MKKLEKAANEVEPGSFKEGKFQCKHHGSKKDGCVYFDKLLLEDAATSTSDEAVASVAREGKTIVPWNHGMCITHPYQIAQYIVSNKNASGLFAPHPADWKVFFTAYIRAVSGKNASCRQEYLRRKPVDSIKVVRKYLMDHDMPPTERKILELGEIMVSEFFREPYQVDEHYIRIKKAFDHQLKDNLAYVLRTVEKEFAEYGKRLSPPIDLGKVWQSRLREEFETLSKDPAWESDKKSYGEEDSE